MYSYSILPLNSCSVKINAGKSISSIITALNCFVLTISAAKFTLVSGTGTGVILVTYVLRGKNPGDTSALSITGTDSLQY